MISCFVCKNTKKTLRPCKVVRLLLCLAAGMAMVLGSCATIRSGNDGKAVSYIVANHYYVNSSVSRPIREKITDQAAFDKLFGMAAVMGKNGEPTPIDFQRQFVIAVSEGIVSQLTAYEPLSLKAEGKRLVFTYKVERGKHISYAMRPLLMIVVGKKWEQDVTFVSE